jgi:leucyl aminopeptidase
VTPAEAGCERERGKDQHRMFSMIKTGGRTKADVVVLAHFEGESLPRGSKEHDHDGLAAALAKRPEATGEAGSVLDAMTDGGRGAPKRVVLIGLGPKDSFDHTTLHNVAAALGKHLARINASVCELRLDAAIESAKADAGLCARAIGESLALLTFDRSQFKGSASEPPKRSSLTVRVNGKRLSDSLEYGIGLGESANVARTLSETPPNKCTPDFIASEARKLARQTGMKCTVIPFKKLLEEGLVGIHTVGQASDHTPCLVRLEYTPERARRGAKPAVLVGKTITYDSGGLSLKTGGSMRGMKRDMDGGAGVFGAMHAIATVVKPKRPVVALFCCAENAISDEAYRPDDIIEYPNGVNVEVTNTDAEGRLVLADGLIRACQKEKPAYIVDMATLTGGVVVALGSTYAGMWCDDDDLRAAVEKASHNVGERVWRLPLHQEYRDMMRSNVADIVNSAPVRAAHPIQGAAFLSYFVEEGVPWCHLDIAGVHSVEGETGPYAKASATGFGTRLLAELVDNH